MDEVDAADQILAANMKRQGRALFEPALSVRVAMNGDDYFPVSGAMHSAYVVSVGDGRNSGSLAQHGGLHTVAHGGTMWSMWSFYAVSILLR